MNRLFRIAVISLVVGFAVGSCKADPLIFPEPSGSTGSSAASSVSSSSSAESSASSSGQGNGGSGSALPCDPCESANGIRIIRQRKIVSSLDGLKSVSDFGYWDANRNEQCSVYQDELGVERCFPVATATTTSNFSDANCTIQVAAAVGSACGGTTPKYTGGITFLPDMCSKTVSILYGIGQKISGPVYQKSGMNCVVATPLPGFDYYEIGSKIPPSEFAEIKTEYGH